MDPTSMNPQPVTLGPWVDVGPAWYTGYAWPWPDPHLRASIPMTERFIEAAHDAIYRALPARRAEGQGMVEYGLILAGVALLAIVGLVAVGPKIGALMNTIGSSLS